MGEIEVDGIAWENAEQSTAAATIGGVRWSGLTRQNRHWPALQAALAAGAVAQPYPAEARRRAEEAGRMQARLASLDQFAARPLRAKAAGTATAKDEIILDALEREADALRDRLAQLAALPPP